MIKGADLVLKKVTRLESKRIILRKFDPADAEDVLEYGSDAQTLKWLIWPGINDVDGALDSINGYYSENPGVFAIELRDTRKCVGAIDLRLDITNEKASFGYVLNRKFWGKGYMTEALEKLLELAFNLLKLNRVESTHYTGNEASGRVMQKCGMTNEGVFRKYVKVKGIYHDVVQYAILKKDWQSMYYRHNQTYKKVDN